MLAIKLSYLAAIVLGFVIGYAYRILTEKPAPKKETKHVFPADLEAPKVEIMDYDHLVEVVMDTNDTYTYVNVIIDGVAGGREKTFVSYRVREAVKAHALIVYVESTDSDFNNRLEAIGASRRDGVYLVDRRRYKVTFKQAASGGVAYCG